MGPYSAKPARLLECVSKEEGAEVPSSSYCAGFEVKQWRCNALASHLIEWIADYALKSDDLNVNHGNMYVRLREAAVRIYTSDDYAKRGEVGEIILHAICRDFFDTVPIAPRVFYLTSSNEVVKSFDLVHVRYVDGKPELWLGEAKFYKDSAAGIADAIKSIANHIDQGFLNREKLILGPQISEGIPGFAEIRALLSVQTSLDKLFQSAIFPVCIAADSPAVSKHSSHCAEYSQLAMAECASLVEKLVASGLTTKIRIILIYVPLLSKKDLSAAFDARLKALTL